MRTGLHDFRLKEKPMETADNAINTDEGAKGVFVFAIGIDQVSARDFAINLVNWSRNNPKKPIRINVNSQGGIILDSLFLFDTLGYLRTLGHHITIAVYGRSASCASWFLQAADLRIIGANSWLLIHEVASEVKGTRTAIRAELERVDQLQAQTNAILCSRTKNVVNGLTCEKIERNIAGGRDWWLNALQSKAEGLVDEIEEVPAYVAAPGFAPAQAQA